MLAGLACVDVPIGPTDPGPESDSIAKPRLAVELYTRGIRLAPVAESSGITIDVTFEEPGEFEALGDVR